MKELGFEGAEECLSFFPEKRDDNDLSFVGDCTGGGFTLLMEGVMALCVCGEGGGRGRRRALHCAQ